jgi:eukaryotic-like serine/threonine-protein kinase
MSNKIGRFEIISQVAKSPFATVYKATDPESQQTIALKAVALSNVLDRDALVKAVFEESDRSKPLNSPNIAGLYGVGDEEGQLLAAAEYIQGNPIATTLARGDGFSIWDIQDIARQVCHALDHAQAHKVVHQSLEPAKIMVQWDGVVKVLGFGISSMNGIAGTAADVPEILHYVSPEQMRGEATDHRSAIFSLGVILYEMATDQKAFAGETADQVRAAILESTPAAPKTLKAKVGPGLSDLIMKSISKSPDERYQSGQELVHDLEQCNAAPKKVTTVGPPKPKSQAAAAGVSAAKPDGPKPNPLSTPAAANSASSADTQAVSATPAPVASAAAATQKESPKPSFAVDPMMAENDSGTSAAAARKSFSELEELPPLKEIFVPSISPSEPAAEEAAPVEIPAQALKKKQEEKPKVQVREAARKAATEIRNTPKQLYGYAIGGAILLIAVIIAGLTIYNFFQDHDSGGSSAAPSQAVSKPAPPKHVAPPPPPVAAPAAAPDQAAAAIQPPPPAEPDPNLIVTEEPEKPARGSRHSRPRVEATPQLAKLTVGSTPAGAQISFDGSPLCQSPCTLTDIAPGQHVVLASKTGYGSESRTINLKAGASSSITIPLGSLSAMLSVSSTPSGGAIVIDGQDTGRLTPSQFIVNKPGSHTVVVRRSGYLEASSTINAQVGQTTTVNLTLAQLGQTDDIRSAGGKFKKILNRGESATMGVVSIKTQPKGAQIMVNNRVLDKTSPFDFYLNPGTYVIDVTMSGYRSVHRVINVEEGEKVAIEETLLPQ